MTSTLTAYRFGQSFCQTSLLLAIVVFGATAFCADQLQTDPKNPDLAGHFRGQVLGPDAKPFTGAKIRVVPLSENLSGKWAKAEEIGPAIVRATTGTDGRFDIYAPDVTLPDLDGLPTNRLCLVIASADGYGPDWVQVRGRARSSTAGNPARTTNLKLQLVVDDVTITGRILGPNGKPLADARVQATAMMIPKGSDLSGHLDREIKKSIHSNFFSGASPYEREFYFYSELFPDKANARTDADGRFTLADIGRDRLVRLMISAPSVVNTTFTAMTRDVPDVLTRTGGKVQIAEEHREYYLLHGARFTRQLKPGRTISGVVLDAKTGEPIPGMLVGLGYNGKPRGGIRSHQTATDAKGRFKITGIDLWNDNWSVTAVSPPGLTYLPASMMGQGDAPVVIECTRGIPFHLKVVDERGMPVTAEVTGYDVSPNPHAPRAHVRPCYVPLSAAVQDGKGVYHGFVSPGPGAVLVKTPTIQDYRPASVDPKAFFAPERKVWTAQEMISSYGTHDTVAIGGGRTRQDNYAAIVLVNPTGDSPPLELTATVSKEPPRLVTVTDPEGKPIVGVTTAGVTGYNGEPPLRTATFPLFRLHPERARRIIFRHEERKLTGYLVASGGGTEPYRVTLEPWATIKGRLVDEVSNPLPLGQKDTVWEQALHVKASLPDDPDNRHAEYADVDRTGRFALNKLIPGQHYNGLVYQYSGRRFRHSAFADLVLEPGEVRDLGDIPLTIRTLARAGTMSDRLSPLARKDLRQPFAVARFGGLAQDSPAARLPLVTRVTVDGR